MDSKTAWDSDYEINRMKQNVMWKNFSKEEHDLLLLRQRKEGLLKTINYGSIYNPYINAMLMHITKEIFDNKLSKEQNEKIDVFFQILYPQ